MKNYKSIVFLSFIVALFSFFQCKNPEPENKIVEKPADSIQIKNEILIPSTFQSNIFTDVHSLLLINYPKRISWGEYVYTTYSIKPGFTEFLIEFEYRNKQKSTRIIPFTKEVIRQVDSSSKNSKDSILISLFRNDQYFSIKENFIIKDTNYTVFKHVTFNCYDPFCASKHNHGQFVTGVTYFSPDYGILVTIDSENLQFELLSKMKEKKVPHELIIEILNRQGVEKGIINKFKEIISRFR